MSAYDNVVGGKLKLKGKALDVRGGGVKKKKNVVGGKFQVETQCCRRRSCYMFDLVSLAHRQGLLVGLAILPSMKLRSQEQIVNNSPHVELNLKSLLFQQHLLSEELDPQLALLFLVMLP